MSFDKIEKFLALDDVQKNLKENVSKSDYDIQIKGNFSWGLTEPKFEDNVTLKNLNFSVKKGEFICVIGDVGAGKSSLLNSISGDMIYIPDKYMQNNSN